MSEKDKEWKELHKDIKWVKQNTSLHKQLTDSFILGKSDGLRKMLSFLFDEGAFDKDYINWLIEAEFKKDKYD